MRRERRSRRRGWMWGGGGRRAGGRYREGGRREGGRGRGRGRGRGGDGGGELTFRSGLRACHHEASVGDALRAGGLDALRARASSRRRRKSGSGLLQPQDDPGLGPHNLPGHG
eukprot:746162-Hanusia_phi.AAC.1